VVKLLREEGSHATNLTFGHNNTSRSNWYNDILRIIIHFHKFINHHKIS
jgi:hypothetical protein